LASLEHEPAAVRDDRAGEGLHQRRLACAVVADQRVDLAAAQLEVAVAQRLNAPVALAKRGRLQYHAVNAHRSTPWDSSSLSSCGKAARCRQVREAASVAAFIASSSEAPARRRSMNVAM